MSVVVQVGKAASSSLVVQAGSTAQSGVDWTAISAIATFMAALIALVVGVLPILLSRHKRRKQARTVGKVAIDVLTLQALQLGAAMEVPVGGDKVADSWQYKQITKAVSVIDSKQLLDLVEYSEFFSAKVEAALAQCIAMLEVAKRRLIFLHEPQPGDKFMLGGDVKWYADVQKDVLALRGELTKWLGKEAEDINEDARKLAMNLRMIALQDYEDWNARNPGAPH